MNAKEKFIEKIINFDIKEFLEKEFSNREKLKKDLAKINIERFIVWLRDKYGK